MAAVDPRLPVKTMSVFERTAWQAIPILAFCSLLYGLFVAPNAPLPWGLEFAWIPAIGLDFALHIDGLSALMLLLITGVGSAVFVYAGGYLDGHPQLRRIYISLTLFALAMVGCVSADNLLLLFVFWELTSLLSFLLVGFNHHDEFSRKCAQQALLITGAGGLCMLGGFVVLGQLADTWRISEIITLLPNMPETTAFYAAMGLIMVGAFTKSAQFPFHFWLPNAMAAPTPVSAYLHSATMVKLGVYLLARLDAGMDSYIWWQVVLQGFGSFTAVWGMVLALRERDLKRILAWSTVATLGTLVFIVGMVGQHAAMAVATLLLAHAMYKATLFFVAGNVDHGTGTRLIDHLRVLRKAMPFTAAAAMLGGLSMSGLPGTFGYIAKEVLVEAKHDVHPLMLTSDANTVFTAIGIAVAATIAVRVFWQARNTEAVPKHIHEGNWAMVVPPLALSVLGVVLGLMPGAVQHIMAQAAVAMHPSAHVAQALPLALSAHGLQTAASTLATVWAIGIVVFLVWELLRRVTGLLFRYLPTGHGSFQKIMQGIVYAAVNSSRSLQHGRLPAYHAFLVLAFAVGLLAAMIAAGTSTLPAWQQPSLGSLVAGGLIVTGSIVALATHNRLAFALASGLVGYGSAVMFLFAGAPDLAFTQFSVETVLGVVIAAVLVIMKLAGKGDRMCDRNDRWNHLLLAGLSATVITALMLAVLAQPFNPMLAEYFGSISVPKAHGRNVVNVILVDFRAFDTLGEGSVVFLALLSALPLLLIARRKLQPNDKTKTDEDTA